MSKPTARTAILEAWDEVLAEIEAGKPPHRLCKERGWSWAVFNRVAADPDRSDAYARAREAGWKAIAEEIISISDDGSNDTYEDDDGKTVTNHDVIARSRLRVDTRKWLLSKMLPKVYGDKMELEHSGAVDVTLELTPLLPTTDLKQEEARVEDLKPMRRPGGGA